MDYIGLECINGTIQSRNIYTATTLIKIVALGLIDLVVVFGNSLVIAAVMTTRKLRTVTNIFIVSLACADLLLGFAVMPFSISYEVVKIWLWGNTWCNMWLAIDVWLCTASILSLCAISLDRYIAVTHPIRYPSLVSPFRGKMLVSSVWILSFAICLPPLLGWNDAGDDRTETNTHTILNNTSNYYTNTEPTDIFFDYTPGIKTDEYFFDGIASNFTNDFSNQCSLELPECELTPTKGYRVYAAMGSFFIPSLVMVFFYFKIFLTAKKTAASLRAGVLLTKTSNDLPQQHGDDTIQLRIHRGGSTSCSVYSNKRHSANESVKYNACANNKYKSHTLSTSAQPVSSHINDTRDCSHLNNITDKSKNNHIAAKKKKRSLKCLEALSKRRHKDTDGGNMILKDRLHSEELNSSMDADFSDTKTLNDKLSVNYDRSSNKGNKTHSAKRCRLLIKESKFTTYSAKGHAKSFRREEKAAKTLAIIVGAFIFCWCPFFTIYLIGAFCYRCVSDYVFSVFFWLGYINSALNPCIYAMFARDFRAAFRRILLCKQRKGFNQTDRADYITGKRKTHSQIQELDSFSD